MEEDEDLLGLVKKLMTKIEGLSEITMQGFCKPL